MEDSIARQLGALSEAVSTLKRNDEKIFDAVGALHSKMDERFERDAHERGNMLRDMGKMSGSVSLIVSLFFLFVKEGVSRMFNK